MFWQKILDVFHLISSVFSKLEDILKCLHKLNREKDIHNYLWITEGKKLRSFPLRWSTYTNSGVKFTFLRYARQDTSHRTTVRDLSLTKIIELLTQFVLTKEMLPQAANNLSETQGKGWTSNPDRYIYGERDERDHSQLLSHSDSTGKHCQLCITTSTFHWKFSYFIREPQVHKMFSLAGWIGRFPQLKTIKSRLK